MKTNLLKLLTDAEAFVSTRACTPQGRRLASRLAAAVKAEKRLEVPLLDDSMPCPLEVPEGWVEVKTGKVKKHDLCVLNGGCLIRWANGLVGDSIEEWLEMLPKEPFYRHTSRL
jgi:hypothetical protein